ncbi:hypothetical protein GOBAR_DD17324 [Gossypium barbadense]|nr:hypothetical protein GOBAR_DD17324 [Gossypium barbadense]
MFATQRGGKAVVDNTTNNMHLARDKSIKIEKTYGELPFPLAWVKLYTKRSTWNPHLLNAVEEAQLKRLQTSPPIRYEQVHSSRNVWQFCLIEECPNNWDDVDFITLDETQLDRIKPCNEAWPYGDNSVITKMGISQLDRKKQRCYCEDSKGYKRKEMCVSD